MSVADIDECDLGTDNCSSNATCTDTDGSYDCTCRDGYSGDGFNCSGEWRVTLTTMEKGERERINQSFICADIDECAMSDDLCDMNATCSNVPGSFQCSCNTGFTGSGTTCSEL